jgi:hypothetical protein
MGKDLSFQCIQALLDALELFPPAHPKRWECIASHVLEASEPSTECLTLQLPNSRKQKTDTLQTNLRAWFEALVLSCCAFVILNEHSIGEKTGALCFSN